MKIAIAFSTKDRTDLSKRSVVPLLQPDKFDLFWIDGSKTIEGQELPEGYSQAMHVRGNVGGGADAAIVYALTEILKDKQFGYIGLVENDVLLDADWFEPTMALFEKGRAEGLEVGAVSARSYEDRILIQRDGYAVMHNLGAGMVIFTRAAAEAVLQNYRTGHTWENRRVFMQVCGLDVAQWSLFCRDAHSTTVDWQFDRILAQYGLASLALTPAKCQMIGQIPSLAEQGLMLCAGSVEERRQQHSFETLVHYQKTLRDGTWKLPTSPFLVQDDGGLIVMPHQMKLLGGSYLGNWKLKWSQGLGPFSWQSNQRSLNETPPQFVVPVSGPCSFLVSGGPVGATVQVQDTISGYDQTINLVPEGENQAVLQLQIPAGVAYRILALKALTPGVTFYGLNTKEPQPWAPNEIFDFSVLPPT